MSGRDGWTDFLWRLATWALPALLVSAFADRLLLARLGEGREVEGRMAAMRRDVYQQSWLDSALAAGRGEVARLESLQAALQRRLTPEVSPQSISDGLRAMAQGAGIEVTKATTSLSRRDSLPAVKVRLDGQGGFPSLIAFCDSMRVRHPNLYLQGMTVRRGPKRLELTLQVTAFQSREEAP